MNVCLNILEIKLNALAVFLDCESFKCFIESGAVGRPVIGDLVVVIDPQHIKSRNKVLAHLLLYFYISVTTQKTESKTFAFTINAFQKEAVNNLLFYEEDILETTELSIRSQDFTRDGNP